MHIINTLRPFLKKIFSDKTYYFLRSIYRKVKYPINETIELVIHFLRYFSLYNPDYKINLNLGFGKEESDFFLSKLKQCEFYLEYGTGKSTLHALKFNKKFIAVESDKNFYNYMKSKIDKHDIFRFVDFGIVKFASIPIFFNLRKNKLSKLAYKYNFDILDELSLKDKVPDLILVDGRYRVLTGIALYKFFQKKQENFLIIFDDYFKRDFYNILDKLFHIEKVGRFGVTSKLKYVDNSELENLIKIFLKDFR